MSAGSGDELVAPIALEHKNTANALFSDKEYLKAAEEYQLAVTIVSAQLNEVTQMKQTLSLNKARSLFQHANSIQKSQDRSDFLRRALREAKAAVGMNPNNAKGHYILGRILIDVGKTRAALTALRRAKRLDPKAVNNRKAKKFLESNKDVPSLPDKEVSAVAKRRPSNIIVKVLHFVRSQAIARRGYIAVAAVWWLLGVVAKSAGYKQLAVNIHRFLKLALLAGLALYAQGQVQHNTRKYTKLLIAKIFG